MAAGDTLLAVMAAQNCRPLTQNHIDPDAVVLRWRKVTPIKTRCPARVSSFSLLSRYSPAMIYFARRPVGAKSANITWSCRTNRSPSIRSVPVDRPERAAATISTTSADGTADWIISAIPVSIDHRCTSPAASQPLWASVALIVLCLLTRVKNMAFAQVQRQTVQSTGFTVTASRLTQNSNASCISPAPASRADQPARGP